MIITKPLLAIVGLIIITITTIVIYYYYYDIVVLREKPPELQEVITPEGKDKFGIDEIYPTVKGGREWFINMQDPLKDNAFSIVTFPLNFESTIRLGLN